MGDQSIGRIKQLPVEALRIDQVSVLFSKHTVCMDGFKDSGLKCTVCFAGCIGKGIAGKKKVKEL